MIAVYNNTPILCSETTPPSVKSAEFVNKYHGQNLQSRLSQNKEEQLVISPKKVSTQRSVKIWQDQISAIIRNKGLCHIFKPIDK